MVVLLLVLLAQAPTPAIVTIARGEFSGITDLREVLVRAPAEWNALWKAHGASQAVPAVDFSTERVAAVFLGTRPTGGFRVEITGARREADMLVIEYVERRPDPADILTQVVTSPFHIVKIPRHNGTVRFQRQSGAVK